VRKYKEIGNKLGRETRRSLGYSRARGMDGRGQAQISDSV